MGQGIGANRGALPCHKLAGSPHDVRLLVPLPPDESLWIGFMLQADIAVSGRTAENENVCLTEVAKSREWTLLAAESIASKDNPRPIDATTFRPAAQPSTLERDHLIFQIIGNDTSKSERLGVVLGTGELYASLSGLPPPGPTSPSQAYRGWRLP